jgi:hypothetical protein
VRSLLLTLLGRRTWSLPRAFERHRPRIKIEAATTTTHPSRAAEPAFNAAA